MTITRGAAKAKGRKLQKEIAETLHTKFNLDERDIVSTPSSCTGMDIILSQKAREMFPFAIEAKWNESISIWECLKQAEKNAEGLTPLLVFKRNRSDTYCCLKFEDFLSLFSKGNVDELPTVQQTND